MPHRRTVKGVSLLALVALFVATMGMVFATSNALAIRDNCHRISRHSDRTRAVFEEQLAALDRGELDDDYTRFFGPDGEARKKAQRDNLVHQIEVFQPIDCTVTILRWIKGD